MSRTVLICDDTLFMRAAIRQYLATGDYEVVAEASNGIEAEELYRKHRPDLVTMDLVMPERPGVEAVRRIVEFDPDARVVMCSAMGQESLVNEAMSAGARGWVTKPFSAPQLIEALETAMSTDRASTAA